MNPAIVLLAAVLGLSHAQSTGRFAYSTNAGDIWVVNADGSQRRKVTHSGGGFDFGPRWSPDGRSIVFQTTRGARPPAGETNVFVVEVATGRERQLTVPSRFRYGGASPDWSPGGRLIVFASPHGLAVVPASGGRVTLLGVAGDGPIWSPDGRHIAYASRDHDLYVVGRAGGGARRVTHAPGDQFPGAWSPDGTTLAYFSGRNGRGHVWIVVANGTHARQLTTGTGTQFPAAWLPDWKLLVSVSTPGRRSPTWVLGPQELPQLAGAIAVDWHR